MSIRDMTQAVLRVPALGNQRSTRTSKSECGEKRPGKAESGGYQRLSHLPTSWLRI